MNKEKQKSLLTYHRGQKVLHSYSPRQASLPLENQKPQSEMSDGYRWKKRYAGIFCDYVYISIVVEQTADRKHVPQSTGLVSRLKKKYRFSFSHQEPKPWSKSWAVTKATCSVDPGPVAVELSLNLLLASQLHEGPAVFYPLPLLGEFPAEPNQTKQQDYLFTLWGYRDLKLRGYIFLLGDNHRGKGCSCVEISSSYCSFNHKRRDSEAKGVSSLSLWR